MPTNHAPDILYKVGTYLTNGSCLQLMEECESELVLQVVVNAERMEASMEAVGVSSLPRKLKICVSKFFSIYISRSTLEIIIYQLHSSMAKTLTITK